MTLEEAIEHCKDVEKEKRYECAECMEILDYDSAEECNDCAEVHKQVAEWLTELKQRREAEITAPPKSNADRIRAMTDKELAEMVSMKVCRIVKPDGKDCPKGFYFGKCDKCVLAWLKQEVSEDDIQ